MDTQRTSYLWPIPKPLCIFSIGKYSKSTAKRTSVPRLPLQIVETILSGLPVKSLLRFKAVSKPWNQIISDPAFIRNHHRRSKPHDLFLCNLAPDQSLSLVRLEDTKLETVETEQSPNECRYVLCFCDGVLLFSIEPYDRRYLLWNPFAGTEIRLDDIPCSVFPDTFGVCRNPIDGDLKVVVVCNQYYAVYSCENRSWTNFKLLHLASLLARDDPGISVDGAIYWVFWRNDDNNNCRSYSEIAYYDPREDMFKSLQKPKDVDDGKTMYLVALGGSLCLYCCDTNMRTKIWAKEKGIDKYCWEVLLIVDITVWSFHLQPQCLLGNKIMLQIDRELVVYSPLENKSEQIGEGTRVFGRGLIPYMPLPTITRTTPKTKKPMSSLHNIIDPTHLLFDVVEIILLRLPVTALLRFKAVSKSWNTTISDPVFIKNHHQMSKSRNSQDLFLCNLPQPYADDLLCLVKLEDNKLEIVETQQTPCGGRISVACFCDGVLLYEDSRGRYVVWNPSTRTEMARLDIPYRFSGSNDITLGVCRDPITTDDFKVVVVCYDNYAVYSGKKRSWNNVKPCNNVSYWSPSDGPGVSVDGAIYWVFFPLKNAKRCSEIKYFDPRDDEFKILQKPKDVGDLEWINLIDLGGSLCLYCYGANNLSFKIWTKEKGIDNNCWRLFVIVHNHVDMSSSSFHPRLLCLLGNKILLRNNYDRSLVVYNPLENKFEKFEQFEGTWLHRLGLIPYVPLPIGSNRPNIEAEGLT